MPGGRPRLPTPLKVVAGTARKHRLNPDEPDTLVGLPAAPEWLSERAAEIFRERLLLLDAMRLASQSDIDMLAVLASRLESIEICTVSIEDGGRWYVTENGTRKPVPALVQRNEDMRHVQSLLAEFGLSPSSRSKVSAAKKKPEENGFKELLG